MGRMADRFTRVEPRRTARAFVRGLLAPIERKNCWWLAEHAGLEGPQAMQRLLRTARLDADGLRDDVRAYVAGHLGHRDGVLIVDETGFLKKGTRSAGVQRQYTGTAGRIENSQVGGSGAMDQTNVGRRCDRPVRCCLHRLCVGAVIITPRRLYA
jgi:SRSO17 transposase